MMPEFSSDRDPSDPMYGYLMQDIFENDVFQVGSGDDGEVYTNGIIAIKLFRPDSDHSEMNIATVIKTTHLSEFDPDIIMIGMIDGIPAIVREELSDLPSHYQNDIYNFMTFCHKENQARRRTREPFVWNDPTLEAMEKDILGHYKDDARELAVQISLLDRLKQTYYEYAKSGICLADMHMENLGYSSSKQVKLRDLSKCDIITQLPDYPSSDITSDIKVILEQQRGNKMFKEMKLNY